MNAHRALLVGAAGLVLALATSLRSSALLVLAAALLALVGIARARAVRALAALHAFREAPRSSTEGETVPVRLALENRGRRPALLVRLEDSFGASLAETRALLEGGPLPPRVRRRYEYRGDCSKGWGVHTLGSITIRAADPLGLFPRAASLPDFAPIAVYPRLEEAGFLPFAGVRTAPDPQAASAPRSGPGALHLGVRDYRRGDDTRRIHWPATARRGAPVVKETETELVPWLGVVVDLDRRHRAGTGRRSTAEAIVRTAAALLHTGTRRGWTVQLVGEGAAPLRLPPGSGALHLAFALHRLMLSRQAGEVALLDLLEAEAARVPSGASLAIVSGSLWLDDARLDALLARLRSHGVAVSFVLVSGDSYVPSTRHAAAPETVAAREQQLLRMLRRRGVPAAVVHADDDLQRVLAGPAA